MATQQQEQRQFPQQNEKEEDEEEEEEEEDEEGEFEGGESSDEEDEEPKLKYQRLGSSVMEILKRHEASCMAVHEKFLVSLFFVNQTLPEYNLTIIVNK